MRAGFLCGLDGVNFFRFEIHGQLGEDLYDTGAVGVLVIVRSISSKICSGLFIAHHVLAVFKRDEFRIRGIFRHLVAAVHAIVRHACGGFGCDRMLKENELRVAVRLWL